MKLSFGKIATTLAASLLVLFVWTVGAHSQQVTASADAAPSGASWLKIGRDMMGVVTYVDPGSIRDRHGMTVAEMWMDKGGFNAYYTMVLDCNRGVYGVGRVKMVRKSDGKITADYTKQYIEWMPADGFDSMNRAGGYICSQ